MRWRLSNLLSNKRKEGQRKHQQECGSNKGRLISSTAETPKSTRSTPRTSSADPPIWALNFPGEARAAIGRHQRTRSFVVNPLWMPDEACINLKRIDDNAPSIRTGLRAPKSGRLLEGVGGAAAFGQLLASKPTPKPLARTQSYGDLDDIVRLGLTSLHVSSGPAGGDKAHPPPRAPSRSSGRRQSDDAAPLKGSRTRSWAATSVWLAELPVNNNNAWSAEQDFRVKARGPHAGKAAAAAASKAQLFNPERAHPQPLGKDEAGPPFTPFSGGGGRQGRSSRRFTSCVEAGLLGYEGGGHDALQPGEATMGERVRSESERMSPESYLYLTPHQRVVLEVQTPGWPLADHLRWPVVSCGSDDKSRDGLSTPSLVSEWSSPPLLDSRRFSSSSVVSDLSSPTLHSRGQGTATPSRIGALAAAEEVMI